MVNTVHEYTDARGKNPFREWISNLRDRQAADIISAHIERMKLRKPKDSRAIGKGVHELRIHYGPGYRLYYAQEGGCAYLLLCGGDKSSQSRDIGKAKAYWQDHKRRQRA